MSDWSRELLDRLREQADQMITDFQEQDALSIDLAGQVGSLPGKVIDVLAAMKDKLNPDSRAAIASIFHGWRLAEGSVAAPSNWG